MEQFFLSLHPFYEDGPILGRKQANMGFINALFRKNPFDQYHFFVTNPSNLINTWQKIPEAQNLLQAGALHAFSYLELENKLKNVPYTVCHLSDPMSNFSAMCQVRNKFAPNIFPITAVNHSINYSEYASVTLGHIWAGCCARDGIGCTSNTSINVMQEWYTHARQAYNIPNNWAEPRLKLIPLGVPDPSLGVSPEHGKSLRKELGLAEQDILILLFGRISIIDKMDTRPLFSALRRIRIKHPQCSFLLFMAGAANEADVLQDEMHKLALAWDIPFKIVSNPSLNLVKQLFASADIFASPVDNVQESFGLSLVEAAHAGIPVVASDWSGYRDIVVHEETGFLVPTIASRDTPRLDSMAGVYANKVHQVIRAQQTAIDIPSLQSALWRLMSDPELRKSMGKKAKERAAELYDFDKVIDHWIKFWQELASTPISKEQEGILRKARHPFTLNYAQAFSSYASHNLQAESMLYCTDLGQAFLAKQAPWHIYMLVSIEITDENITQILKFIGQGCTMGELFNYFEQTLHCKNFDSEAFFQHVYWCIKHDLMACEMC